MTPEEDARPAQAEGEKAPAPKEKAAAPAAEPKQMAGSSGEPRGQRPEEFNPDDFE